MFSPLIFSAIVFMGYFSALFGHYNNYLVFLNGGVCEYWLLHTHICLWTVRAGGDKIAMYYLELDT